MIFRKCRHCTIIFSYSDYRTRYCSKVCKHKMKKKRYWLLHEDNRQRNRKRTTKENKQSVLLRRIRENRKGTEKQLIEEITYLQKRIKRLHKELQK